MLHMHNRFGSMQKVPREAKAIPKVPVLAKIKFRPITAAQGILFCPEHYG